MTLEYLVRDYMNGEIQFDFVKRWAQALCVDLSIEQQHKVLAELESIKNIKNDAEMYQKMVTIFRANNITHYFTSRKK